MQLLAMYSSIFSGQGHSSQLVNLLVSNLQKKHPGTQVTYRDLHKNPPAILDAFTVQSLMTPPDKRTAAQAQRVAKDDELIAEVQKADHIIIGIPMYNFAVPVQLKAWFDAITRPDVTYHYVNSGPEGLLKNKKATLILARGGQYRASNDPQAVWLEMMLNFIGISDIQIVYAEGLRMGNGVAQASFEEAIQHVSML